MHLQEGGAGLSETILEDKKRPSLHKARQDRTCGGWPQLFDR